MHMKALCGVLCVGFLAACAQVPRPSTYPYSFQPQMQAAEHWQTLAVQMVESLPSRTEPVYLQEDDSLFGRALRSFLQTELTESMLPTSCQPCGAGPHAHPPGRQQRRCAMRIDPRQRLVALLMVFGILAFTGWLASARAEGDCGVA
jgi:hypothetical protein